GEWPAWATPQPRAPPTVRVAQRTRAEGYAERRPHLQDARARLVVLTERGWACTRAAEAAAAEVVGGWAELLGEAEVRVLEERLARIAPYGPVRPAW
ncbi:hypothetical protein ACWDZ8_33210, partial [Streptomyces sp. NPDC003233]